MRRLKYVLAATVVSAIGLLPVTASAAPITCPGPQEPTKVSGGWVCENPADNPTGAAETKNPND